MPQFSGNFLLYLLFAGLEILLEYYKHTSRKSTTILEKVQHDKKYCFNKYFKIILPQKKLEKFFNFYFSDITYTNYTLRYQKNHKSFYLQFITYRLV